MNNRYGESLFDCAPSAAFHAMASRPWFPAAIDVSALRVSAPGDLNRAFVSVNRGSSPSVDPGVVAIAANGWEDLARICTYGRHLVALTPAGGRRSRAFERTVKQYTVACREQVVRAIDAGLTRTEAAQRFGMSVSSIGSWQRRQREEGHLAPAHRPGRRPLIGPEAREALQVQIETHPEATVAGHRALWEADHQVLVSIGTMYRALKSAGWCGRRRLARERT